MTEDSYQKMGLKIAVKFRFIRLENFVFKHSVLNIFCHFHAFPKSMTAPYNGIVMWIAGHAFLNLVSCGMEHIAF